MCCGCVDGDDNELMEDTLTTKLCLNRSPSDSSEWEHVICIDDTDALVNSNLSRQPSVMTTRQDTVSTYMGGVESSSDTSRQESVETSHTQSQGNGDCIWWDYLLTGYIKCGVISRALSHCSNKFVMPSKKHCYILRLRLKVGAGRGLYLSISWRAFQKDWSLIVGNQFLIAGVEVVRNMVEAWYTMKSRLATANGHWSRVLDAEIFHISERFFRYLPLGDQNTGICWFNVSNWLWTYQLRCFFNLSDGSTQSVGSTADGKQLSRGHRNRGSKGSNSSSSSSASKASSTSSTSNSSSSRCAPEERMSVSHKKWRKKQENKVINITHYPILSTNYTEL